MTQRPDRRQSANIWVEATPGRQRIEPGERAVFAIAVENRSAGAQAQTLTVEGVETSWVSVHFDREAVAFPQERRSGNVVVAVPMDADAGERTVDIVAHAGSDESSAEVVLEILPLRTQIMAPGLTLTPPILEVRSGDREQRVQLDVRNVGAQDAVFEASVEGLPEGWARIDSPVRVAAGSTARHELWVRAPASAGNATHRFTVRVAVSADTAVLTEADGELRVIAARGEPVGEGGDATEEPQPEVPTRTQPDVTQATTIDLPVEDGAVLAPDVLLAPSTTFRFGTERVSDQALITIQNRSRVTDRYVIEVHGLPDGWYTLTATDISLEPEATQQVPLRLSPRPGPEYPAGEYQFAIRVMPHGYPGSAREIPALLIIEGVEDFRFELEPPQETGRTVHYDLAVRSVGSRPITVVAEASDLEDRCKFKLPTVPELGPGEEARLPVVVGARRNRFVGPPETFDFRLTMFPLGADRSAGRSFDARFVHRPFLSTRVPVLVAFYGLVVAIVALAIFWAPPHVEAFVEWTGCQIHDGPECEEGAGAPDGDVTPTPVATATTPPTSSPTTTATPVPVAASCTNAPEQLSQVPGLAVSIEAYADDRSNIRSSPALVPNNGNRVGQIRLAEVPQADQLAARTVQITGGPFCGPSFIWWQIRSDYYGIDEGWLVERDAEGEVNLDIEP